MFGLGGVGVVGWGKVDVDEVGEVFDEEVEDIGIVEAVGVELEVDVIGEGRGERGGVMAELEGEFEE